MKRLTHLAVGLFGAVLLLFAFKMVDFFLQSDAGVCLIKIWIPVSVVLAVCFLSKAAGIKWQWSLAFLAGSELLIFCCFELAAHRVALPNPVLSFLQLMYMDKCRSIVQFDKECGQYDNKLFYKLKEGHCRFSNIEFQTELEVNAAGFRDDDLSLEEPELVFIGDSFTMGWGVGQQETFCEQLEKALDKKCLNLGMSSFGTARECLALNRFDLRKTQLLVLQFGPFDELENRKYVKTNFQLPVSPNTSLFREQRLNAIWSQYFPLKYSYVAFFNLAGIVKRCFTTEPIFPEVKTELTSLELDDFFSIVANLRQQFKGNIVLLNFCQGGFANDISQQFSERLKTHPMEKVAVLHVEEKLSKEDFFVLDDHIHAGGHAKVARLLQDFIEERHLLPPK